MSLKRPRSPDPPSRTTPQKFRSAPIHDRASTFLALYSPVTSAPPSVRTALQADPALASASHRILAWRTRSKQAALGPGARRLYETGFDDDGEKHAGRRVEKVLAELDVEGVVVVGRWFGGVMLGPVRFAHIEAVAREAVRLHRREPVAAEVGEERGGKRSKAELDAGQDQSRLVAVLEERDRSIDALRGLLREKSRTLVKEKDTGIERSNKSPKKVIDYKTMPGEALRRLEKARDATIAWILKEITRVEEEQKCSDTNNAVSP